MSDKQTMPGERAGFTKKFSIRYPDRLGQPQEFKFYLSFSTYDDGRLGEIFIKGDKADPTLAGMLDAFAIAFSIGLQQGAPLDDLVAKFRHMRFPPDGFTGDAEIKSCSSLVDLISQYLAWRFPQPLRKMCSQPDLHRIDFERDGHACAACLRRYQLSDQAKEPTP